MSTATVTRRTHFFYEDEATAALQSGEVVVPLKGGRYITFAVMTVEKAEALAAQKADLRARWAAKRSR